MNCPNGHPLAGLGTYCHPCAAYVEDLLAPASAAPEAPQDDRSEKEIQHAIKQTLRTMGFATWDTSQPHAAKITPGLPDLFVVGRGLTAWVEVKRAAGQLTDAQARFRAMVLANGGNHVVARNEADVVEFLNAAGARA